SPFRHATFTIRNLTLAALRVIECETISVTAIQTGKIIVPYVIVGKENAANIDYNESGNRRPIIFSHGSRALMKRVLATAVAVAACAVAAASFASQGGEVRFATFNASLNRSEAGLLATHLSNPDIDDVFRRQIHNVAEVIQREQPDVLLINEF